MTTEYTPILNFALPVTGELDGTWGDIVNDNITSMIEEAIAGLATIDTWTAASHTLTTADGTTSESRCAILVCSGDPGGVAEVICPAASKIYVLRNNTSYGVTLKTSGGAGVEVLPSTSAVLFCDGTDVLTAASTPTAFTTLTVYTTATLPANTSIGSVSGTELGYLTGLAANVQTQINALSPVFMTGEVDNGNSGASITITLSAGLKQRVTLTADADIYIDATGAPTGNYQLILIQDGNNAWVPTWYGLTATAWLGTATEPSINLDDSSWTVVSMYANNDAVEFQSMNKVGAA